RYKEFYGGERWKNLVAKKAMPQRLLWASTGTKNPKYSKTLYVDELIGAETVNTVPADTYNAFKKEHEIRPALTENWAENIEAARETMRTLEEVGISMKHVTDALVPDAVKKFCK